ncbi:MAG TPA: hypothetical protein VFL57_10190 [Bryobacteraceae bacterium]|nr:hypothetical protein [Bryobacteraceae bacterium]
MRLAVASLALCVLAAAEVTAPRVALVRFNDGSVRPLHGTPGSLIVGEPLLRGIEALTFDGTVGQARTRDEILTLNADGAVLDRTPLSSDAPEGEPLAYIDNDDLVLRASGKRLRLPFAIHRIERAASEYLALSGSEGRLLACTAEGREAFFAIPEIAE